MLNHGCIPHALVFFLYRETLNISLDDPLTVLAALEALVGLIIEVTFIATLTQRFFNR